MSATALLHHLTRVSATASATAASPGPEHVVVLEGERYAVRGSSRVRLCWFMRAGQHCMEPVAEGNRDSLCVFHASGGCSLDETTFYSVRTGQFLSTRVALPETNDIKGDRLDDIALLGGGGSSEPSTTVTGGKKSRNERGQFRKCCRVCWTFRRSRSAYCTRHNKAVGNVERRRTSESNIACQFFDLLAQQTGFTIIHRHIRADSVPVGEELKIRLSNDRKVSVDGYVAENNLVLEFLGDFVHGNPARYRPWQMNALRKTTFRTLYDETYARHRAIAERGYRVLYIWESEFKEYLRQPATEQATLLDRMHTWDDWPVLPADPSPNDVPEGNDVLAEDDMVEDEEGSDDADGTTTIKEPRSRPIEILGWKHSPSEALLV